MNIICAPWATRADLCCDIADDVDPALVESAILSASEILNTAIGGCFPGLCTQLLRPCLPCGCPFVCGCEYQRLALPFDTVAIVEVRIDGAPIPTADYFLRTDERGKKWIVAVPGGVLAGCFPYQNMALPDGSVGTWDIRVETGSLPPQAGVQAAAKLACEMIKACTGGECELPDMTESVTRSGVTVRYRIPASGRTGLAMVDNFMDQPWCKQGSGLLDPAS